jgi:hypothetical protein
VDANPFAAPAAGSARPYQPGDYEMQSAHRGGQILALGVTGIAFAVMGLMSAAISIFASNDMAWSLFLGIPLQFISLAVSLPAWAMGHADWRAMRANAMDRAGESRTVTGLRLGQVSAALSLLPLGLWIALLVVEVVGW